MQPPRLHITIRLLLVLLAIIAVAMGATVSYLRSRQASNMSVPGARAVLPGAEAYLRSLTFSADGRTLAVAGAEGSLQLWDTANGWLLASLPAPQRTLRAIAVSSDGRSIAVADSGDEAPSVRESVLRLLRVNYGLLRLPEMGSVKIRAAAADSRIFGSRSVVLSPDDRSLASGGYGTVEIRDRTTLALVHSIAGPFKIPSCLSYSPDGSWLAVGDTLGGLAILDLKDGRQRFWRPEVPNETVITTKGHHGHLSQYGHYRRVRSLVFCDGAKRLVSLGDDNYVKVWDTTTGGLLNSLKIGDLSGWVDRTSVMAVVNSGKKIVTASMTGALGLWDVNTGRRLNSRTLSRGPFVEPKYGIGALAISPDGKTLAGVIGAGGTDTPAENYRVVLWDIGDLQVVPRGRARSGGLRTSH